MSALPPAICSLDGLAGTGFSVLDVVFVLAVLGFGGLLIYRGRYWAAVVLFVAAMAAGVALVAIG